MAVGLYLHIPFCVRRCPYCAFFSTVCGGQVPSSYVDALIQEMRRRRGETEWDEVDTVYLGGGTPSLLSPQDLDRLLGAAREAFRVDGSAEITLEANPGTVDLPKLRAFGTAGVNRLSLGVQSFNNDALRVLGRIHTAEEALEACRAARSAGGDNLHLNLDLILGVPGEGTEAWLRTLRRSVALRPEHLSVYALTVEEGTALKGAVSKGDLRVPSEDEEAEQCERTSEFLRQEGYLHYEVSNYCLPGGRSIHNWGYWIGKPYLGLGASAHSFDGRKRSWNVSDVEAYTASVLSGKDPTEGEEVLDEPSRRFERICLGLRTAEGVCLRPEEKKRFWGSDPVQQWLQAGFVMETETGIALTERGFLRADALSVETAEILQGSCR